jgi:hypothetical protein
MPQPLLSDDDLTWAARVGRAWALRLHLAGAALDEAPAVAQRALWEASCAYAPAPANGRPPATFRTYAMPRIRGAILDLRSELNAGDVVPLDLRLCDVACPVALPAIEEDELGDCGLLRQRLNGVPCQELAARAGVTPGRISQRLSVEIARLRRRLRR